MRTGSFRLIEMRMQAAARDQAMHPGQFGGPLRQFGHAHPFPAATYGVSAGGEWPIDAPSPPLQIRGEP